MSTALIGLAAQVGLPIIRKVLQDRLGGAGGSLAADVIEAVAGRVGVLAAHQTRHHVGKRRSLTRVGLAGR